MLLGASLLISSAIGMFGMYGGHIVDSVPPYPLIGFLIAMFPVSFIGAAISESAWVIFIFLTVLNSSYPIIDIAIKACFGAWLPVEKRGETFSLKYTITNIGHATGPMPGSFLATQNQLFPFFASAIVSLAYLAVFLFGGFGERPHQGSWKNSPQPRFVDTLRTLVADQRLILFTMGGVLSAMAFCQSPAYLSQFLVATADAAFTYKVIASIMTTNAIVVICSQYFIGRLIDRRRLFLWPIAGLALPVVGEIGFATASSIPAWIFFMIIFSLGETIIVPAEYLYVDSIAPEPLRGSYYAAQTLRSLGSAFGPILCRVFISGYGAHGMFYLLVSVIILSGVFYYVGSGQRKLLAGSGDA